MILHHNLCEAQMRENQSDADHEPNVIEQLLLNHTEVYTSLLSYDLFTVSTSVSDVSHSITQYMICDFSLPSSL